LPRDPLVPKLAVPVTPKYKGDYPTIYSDTSNWSWRKESKGGGAVLAYGATRVEFSDTAVFK